MWPTIAARPASATCSGGQAEVLAERHGRRSPWRRRRAARRSAQPLSEGARDVGRADVAAADGAQVDALGARDDEAEGDRARDVGDATAERGRGSWLLGGRRLAALARAASSARTRSAVATGPRAQKVATSSSDSVRGHSAGQARDEVAAVGLLQAGGRRASATMPKSPWPRMRRPKPCLSASAARGSWKALKRLAAALAQVVDARRRERIVGHVEGDLVDDDERERLAGHVDALPEALRREQHRADLLAQLGEQEVARLLALDEQRELRLGAQVGLGDAQVAEAREEQERASARDGARARPCARRPPSRRRRARVGQIRRDVEQRLARVAERRGIDRLGGGVAEAHALADERERARDRERRRGEDDAGRRRRRRRARARGRRGWARRAGSRCAGSAADPAHAALAAAARRAGPRSARSAFARRPSAASSAGCFDSRTASLSPSSQAAISSSTPSSSW